MSCSSFFINSQNVLFCGEAHHNLEFVNNNERVKLLENEFEVSRYLLD